ncbi:MAG: translocation/assembly module TamB domain-containing protein [Bdellovibrio sp.]|nr:translocation/assembly module TamB domain-containing protein [Bdellovibrio sp.]
MIKVNKILIIFFSSIFVIIFALFQFIETKTFTNYLLNPILKKITRPLDIQISVASVDLQFFPPATYFEKVEIEKKDIFKLTLDQAGAVFSLSNLMKNDFNLHSLKLYGGILKVKDVQRKKAEWTLDDIRFLGKAHHDILKFWNQFKLGEIEISKIIVRTNSQSGMIHSAILRIDESKIGLIFEAVDLTFNEHHLDGVRADLALYAEKLEIASLKIENDFNYFAYNGKVGIENTSIEGHIDFSGALSQISEQLPAIKEMNEMQGNLKTSFLFELSKEQKKISNGEIELTDVKFRSKDFKRIAFGFAVIDQNIHIKKLNLQDQTGDISFEKEIKVFNVERKRIIPFVSELRIHNFNLNSILPLIQPNLDRMFARIDMTAVVGIDNQERIFLRAKPGGKVRDFVLKGTSGKKILAIPNFDFGAFLLSIHQGPLLHFNYDLVFKTGNIKGNGYIDAKSLNFDASVSNFELREFGPISDVEITGKANLILKISGLIEKVAINFIGKADEFGVVGLKLGLLDLNLRLDLDNPRLRINQAVGKYKATLYNGSGMLDFTKNGGPALKINLLDGRIEDIVEMCFTDLAIAKTLQRSARGNLKGHIEIGGTFSATGLNVSGNVNIPRLYIYEEWFEKGEASFNYSNKTLQIKKTKLKKGNGILRISFMYDTNTSYMEYDATVEGVMLDDFYYYRLLNLGLQGELSVDLFGSGILEDLSTKNIIKISKSKIKDKYLRDSVLKIYNNGVDVFVDAVLGGDLFTFASYVNLKGMVNKNSNYAFKIKTDDIKNFLGLISVHNIDRKDIDGKVDIEGKGSFNINDWRNMDAELAVNGFILQQGKIYLKAAENSHIQIIKGLIRSWSVEFTGAPYYLKSHALGSLKSGFKITQAFNLPFQLIELLTPKVSFSKGNMKGLSVAKIIDDKFLYSFDLDGTDIGIRTAFTPLAVDDGKFSVNVSGNEILIEKFEGSLGKGRLRGNGKIKIHFPFPEVELYLDFSKTLIPFFKQSSLVFSGNSNIQGVKPPYRIKANVYLVRGEIKDDLNFIRETITRGGSSYKLTGAERIGQQSLVDYNVNLSFLSPLVLRNQLMEFYVMGNSNIWGSEFTINMQSKIDIVPGQSKVFFKGHEFVISKGTIEFDKVNGVKNPLINIRGSTRISGYNIIFDGSGFLDNLTVNFHSEPMLAQEDILSLLTIGVTSQVSKNLQSSDLEAVTSMSLGSILMDQFGVSENLNKSVGVKLSVLPELGQDDINPMQGRAGTAEPGASKMKSATKIKIQKKVKEFDLSFSSTFGGSLQQKQEMNINYNLRPDVSVQGVYEMYSTDSTNNRTSPDSAGVDLIWKKTFK